MYRSELCPESPCLLCGRFGAEPCSGPTAAQDGEAVLHGNAAGQQQVRSQVHTQQLAETQYLMRHRRIRSEQSSDKELDDKRWDGADGPVSRRCGPIL